MRTPDEHITRTDSQTTARRAGLPAAGGVASTPRLVIRGETISTHSDKCQQSSVDGEQLILKSGANHGTVLQRQPIPHPTASAQLAHIDWLAFTCPGHHADREHLLFQGVLASVFNLPTTCWKGAGKGWNGYQHRVNLGEYGLLAYGGRHQNNTVHIELNAHGCALISDWTLVCDWLREHHCKLTRVDLAHDDFEGDTANITTCQAWYQAGLFNVNGRPPKPFLYDDCETGDGKTFEVGSRENGKIARMYEKGKEQGDPTSDWFRIELELKSKDRELPLAMLLKPGQYLAGAYPAFAYLSREQCKVKTMKTQQAMAYAQMVEWVRTSAGKAINVMLQAHQGDMAAVLEQIVRDGAPKRLAPYSVKPR